MRAQGAGARLWVRGIGTFIILFRCGTWSRTPSISFDHELLISTSKVPFYLGGIHLKAILRPHDEQKSAGRATAAALGYKPADASAPPIAASVTKR